MPGNAGVGIVTAPASTEAPGKHPVVIAVPNEQVAGEQRVATVPEVVQKLTKAGHVVRIEHDAGTAAFYPDALYTAAGATVVTGRNELFFRRRHRAFCPAPDRCRGRSTFRGNDCRRVHEPDPEPRCDCKDARPERHRLALELVPRITRAQSMDALSSQATAGGYVAAVLGANNCPKFLPMLTTAAGTIRPATVLILGAGVAGLMAIATAKRLGALVEAYDVRRAAGEQVRSLGAKFIELEINAEGQGGYARELTAEEKVKEPGDGLGRSRPCGYRDHDRSHSRAGKPPCS